MEDSTQRVIRRDVLVPATVAEVWAAWTSAAGARTFFAPDAHIVPEVGGAYELYFSLAAPSGNRGSEGCTVLEIVPETRLVFSWNFPPSLPSIRSAHTRVHLDLEPEAGGTRVVLVQSDWGTGGDWDRGFAYFERAWDLVLGRLRRRFVAGPIDWRDADGRR